jgi:hypothetical protein
LKDCFCLTSIPHRRVSSCPEFSRNDALSEKCGHASFVYRRYTRPLRFAKNLPVRSYRHSVPQRSVLHWFLDFIIIGLFHDWHVAASLNNLRFLGVLRGRALMKGYRDTTQHPAIPSSASNPPEEPQIDDLN